MFDALKAADVIVSWIVGMVMGALGLFWWLDKRSQKIVDDKIAKALPSASAIAELDTDIKNLDTRMRAIETTVAALPTAHEVGELKIAMASVATQLKATAEQVDTLYRAALAADRGRP
ncbi:MAG: DUF2730 domain-containing protein, partial [Hyphomonadaceae bacterium]|nr:DUF2730 domain-containing protein [Hyphomonadaceae bacterium]